MADVEKHTKEEWMKKLGKNERYSKEEYEKMIKRQNTIKGLLEGGRSILQGIGQTVRPIAKNLAAGAAKLEDRLAANYNSAIGSPVFGSSIRQAIGWNPVPPSQRGGYYDQYGRYINRYGQYVSPWQYPGMGQFPTGPQYPQEIFKLPETAITQLGQGQIPVQMTTIPQKNETQTVFLFDDKNDTVSEVLGEFPTVQEAEAEVKALRKQGLPAYYATRGAYTNKALHLKA